FLEASCCKVDVVNGGAGDFLAGLVSKSLILKDAPIFFCKNASASSLVLIFLGRFALDIFPSSVSYIAVIAYECSALKFCISFSRSTIKRTATDCTRPADKPARTFFHKTGDNS